MRIAFIVQNLQAVPKKIGHGHPRVAGKRAHYQITQAMIAYQQKIQTEQRAAALARMIEAQLAFERGLAEARHRQALLKTSLYATLLSEV